MIRKQLYLHPEHDRKLKRLARHWGTSEAAVVRAAIDRLPEDENPVLRRLAEAGLLIRPWPPESDASNETIEALEREIHAWLVGRGEPLGLSDAVLEDRR